MINVANTMRVGVLEDTIVVPGLSPRRLTREEALNLAAWLVTLSNTVGEPLPAFRLLSTDAGKQAFVTQEFVEVLAGVQST